MELRNNDRENDNPLKDLLREWRAPAAPAYLEHKIFTARAPLWRWGRWLLTGSVRIPAPLFALALLALVALLYSSYGAAHKPATPGGISGFEPVKELNVRVVRSDYER